MKKYITIIRAVTNFNKFNKFSGHKIHIESSVIELYKLCVRFIALKWIMLHEKQYNVQICTCVYCRETKKKYKNFILI